MEHRTLSPAQINNLNPHNVIVSTVDCNEISTFTGVEVMDITDLRKLNSALEQFLLNFEYDRFSVVAFYNGVCFRVNFN